MTPTADGGFLAGYVSGQSADATTFDELVDGGGAIRHHWAQLAAGLDHLGADELQRRRTEIRRLLEQDGVTYNTSTGGRRRHQPWNLDAVPLVVPDRDWARIEAGISQRAELLDLILADLYRDRRLLAEGVIPPEIVLGDPQFLRACDGIRLPTERQLVLSATDLAHVPHRGWVALGHRTQAPSGAAYALENRRVLARVFPALFQQSHVQRVGPFVRTLRQTLRAAAPPGIEDPSIVVLSPGPMSETAFEHASIAAQLGYPLVEGADLQVRDGKVWLRTVRRLRPVHVILRRVDAWFADPLELRPDSTLGVAGLVDACRTGAVSVVNPLGSGVLENAALQTLLPRLAQHLLGEDLLLESARAWWCGDASQRSHVLGNLGHMIVRPASRFVHGGSIDTSRLSAKDRASLRHRIEAQPEHWVGQELLDLATAPVLTPTGFERRPTVLRTFAIADGDRFQVMDGGLARSSPSDAPQITSSLGAASKDVWIIGGALRQDDDLAFVVHEHVAGVEDEAPAARAAENLFWLGRYAERAEATVRILRAVNERRDEFQHVPGGPGAAALTGLFETLTRTTGTFPGFVGDDAPALRAEPDAEMFSLLTDAARPGSVAHAIVHMFDAIDVLRDQMSVDTWLVVGSLQRELEELSVDEDRSEDITRVLNDLLEGLLALAGVASESTVRDQAWHFMECGRRIERSLQITALLTTTLASERGAAAETLLLESVLGAGESIITYRRRYRSRARIAAVLELLLLDPGNPRSVMFQLESLRRSLPELDPNHELAGGAANGRIEGLVALLDGVDLAAISRADSSGRRVALDDLGATTRTQLRECSDLIAGDFFNRLLPQLSMVTPVDPGVRST